MSVFAYSGHSGHCSDFSFWICSFFRICIYNDFVFAIGLELLVIDQLRWDSDNMTIARFIHPCLELDPCHDV